MGLLGVGINVIDGFFILVEQNMWTMLHNLN
jgi:hypothetical protein